MRYYLFMCGEIAVSLAGIVAARLGADYWVMVGVLVAACAMAMAGMAMVVLKD